LGGKAHTRSGKKRRIGGGKASKGGKGLNPDFECPLASYRSKRHQKEKEDVLKKAKRKNDGRGFVFKVHSGTRKRRPWCDVTDDILIPDEKASEKERKS